MKSAVSQRETDKKSGVAGCPGARLSLVAWTNVLRFVGEGAISVRNLAGQALAPDNQIKFELGCLERWGFVVLQPDPSSGRPVASVAQPQSARELRIGWGSGRGIRRDWGVSPHFQGPYSEPDFAAVVWRDRGAARRTGLAKTRSAAC